MAPPSPPPSVLTLSKRRAELSQLRRPPQQSPHIQDELSARSLPLVNVYDATSYNEKQIAPLWCLIARRLRSFAAGVFERLRLELRLGSAGPLTSSLLIKQIPPRWRHEEREKRLDRHVRCLRVWRLESERALVAVRGSSEVIEPNPSDAPLLTTFCFKNRVLASSETVGRSVGWSAGRLVSLIFPHR